MRGELQSYLTGTLGLTVLLVISLLLTISRPRLAGQAPERAGLIRLVAVAIGVQALHFLEELGAGFYRRFPEVFGFPSWSATFFVAFNVVWIAIWILGAVGLRAGVVAALVPTWFLALAMVLNAIAHPLLALREGGYFPGLVTAPFGGIAGAVLAHRLWHLTRARK